MFKSGDKIIFIGECSSCTIGDIRIIEEFFDGERFLLRVPTILNEYGQQYCYCQDIWRSVE